jgi:hypothetical protein
VILADHVVARNEWAQALLGRPGVHVASSVDVVMDIVERVVAMWDVIRKLVTPVRTATSMPESSGSCVPATIACIDGDLVDDEKSRHATPPWAPNRVRA